MIYLASPYTSLTTEEQVARYEAAKVFCQRAIRFGYFVYSPIVNCHELSANNKLPSTFTFWCRFNFNMISLAEEFWIYHLPGWDTSVGVNSEIAFWTTTRPNSGIREFAPLPETDDFTLPPTTAPDGTAFTPRPKL